jgi:hypothetical protein
LRLITLMSFDRAAIGASATVLPNTAGKLFGLDPDNNPQASYLARLFGIRDVALAIGTLSSKGTARALWLRLGIMCDAVDAAAAFLAGQEGALPKRAAVLDTALPLLAIGIGIAALLDSESAS